MSNNNEKIRSILLIINVWFTIQLDAQLGKEAWHWEFGNNCALDFSSGTPIVGTSPLNTFEGCASVSDPNTGQLLFYTDGVSVWNRLNHVMPHGTGLLGHWSATQSALAVPYPGSNNLYYIVTADQGGYLGTNVGVHYSIVDMNYNGGLGDVISKNVLLTPPPTTEKLIAVRHCNGHDFWIIDHVCNSNVFNAYLVTSAGIDSIPMISHNGTPEPFGSTVGYLKSSPNGKKLALGIENDTKILQLFDFDNLTGKILSPITISYYDDIEGPYGICFSPDNSKVYAGFPNINRICQYDLNSSNISATEYSFSVNMPQALQTGPDGKIYVASWDQTLSVINNPNYYGPACNFQAGAIHLASGSTSSCGLPNFIEGGLKGNNNHITSFSTICAGNFLTLGGNLHFSNYTWSNGDTTRTISVGDSGKYWVNYQINAECFETDTFHITIKPKPQVNIGSDTSFCFGYKKLDTHIPNCHCSWSTGVTTSYCVVEDAGVYWVEVEQNGCKNRDTVIISPDLNSIKIVYPNIITPNSDGINDYIMFGSKKFASLHVDIFNRWGRKIMESDDTMFMWWGDQFNEKTLDNDTYYYVSQYKANCGNATKSETLKGFITLLR